VVEDYDGTVSERLAAPAKWPGMGIH
jgi:hypothetical protein